MLKRRLVSQISLMILPAFLMLPLISFSQTFTPIAVTGFNQDVIAESGTSSLTTTTSALDGVPSSNKVIYSNAFRIANSFGGGGIPDNGTIVNGTSTYQLAGYAVNNGLIIPRSASGTLTFTTPGQYTVVRILCFSTEGSSLVNGTINFSDGSTSPIASFTLNDWFNGVTNLVLSGFGRCTRSTPAIGAGDYPSNPNFYYANIPIACSDRAKNIQSITINNITTAGNNAPYPNTVLFAASGAVFSTSAAITNATCTTGGSATITVTGPNSPYNISWNTVPVQTGATATNLAPGNYIATITDAAACTITYPVTITQQNNVTLTGNTSTSICAGTSFSTTTTSNATTYAWTANTAPAVAGISNTTIANPVLTPTQTTTYTLTASTGTCSQTNSFTITVNPAPTLTGNTNTSICAGTSFSTTTTSNATTYVWTANTAPAVAGISNTTIANPVLTPTQTTTYTLTASTGSCSQTNVFTITVNPLPTLTGNTSTSICAGTSFSTTTTSNATTYMWTANTAPAVAGISNTTIANPVLTPTQTTTYTLTASTGSCSQTNSFTITVNPPPTLTGNTSTSICAGASFSTTTTSNATTYMWTANTAPVVAGISNTTIANPVLTPSQTTIYTLTASTGSCSQTNSFTITVNSLPVISTRGPLNICTPGSGASPALTSNGTGFSWSPATGVSDPTILNPVLNPTATTPYTVTASLGGCTASSSFTAVVSTAVANAGNPATIVAGNSTTLNGSGSQGTYQWTPSTGLSADDILNPLASPTITTTYTLLITTTAGCTATSNVTVTVLTECLRNFQAFTPNGDGFYDKWVLTDGNCMKNISVLVYNRYGSKVFESQHYNNDWDGTYKNKPLPDGTYYYDITFTPYTGVVQRVRGNVTILR